MAIRFNLEDRAYRALVENGFEPEFTSECAAEVEAARHMRLPPAEDLTRLLWSSIDNEDSRDLDQLEYAERGPRDSIRLLVAIADVASFVRPGMAIEARAARNTVTLYTPGRNFHLLPPALSTGTTSLNENQTRLAVVADLLVETDGETRDARFYHALVRNKAKLSYDGVARGMEHRNGASGIDDQLFEQLRLQDEAAQRLGRLRHEMGALTFSSYEARAVERDGDVVDLTLVTRNRARDLIECFMIAANVATARFLKDRGWPIIERVVEAPRRWDRICQIAAAYGVQLPLQPAPKPLADFLAERREADAAGFRELSLSVVKLLGPGRYSVEYPDGPQTSHFGLALDDYSHSTAPNRRYADMVLQRLLLANSRGDAIPYSRAELEQIAAHCTEREDMARKVERLMRKIAGAYILRNRIGKTFTATVTGASRKGTYVRLKSPPVEGRIVEGEQGLDVGDRVEARLLSVDPECGFIDFARVATNELSARA
jgi:exoribonuclease-2